MIKWEDKAGTDKTQTTCKSYFKELYAKHKTYNKVAGGVWIKKRIKPEGEERSIRRQHQGHVQGTERHIKGESRVDPKNDHDK